jgi:hypothetical protein
MMIINSLNLFLEIWGVCKKDISLKVEVFILINLKDVVRRRTVVFCKERISYLTKEDTKIGDQRMIERVKYTQRFPVLKAIAIFFQNLGFGKQY